MIVRKCGTSHARKLNSLYVDRNALCIRSAASVSVSLKLVSGEGKRRVTRLDRTFGSGWQGSSSIGKKLCTTTRFCISETAIADAIDNDKLWVFIVESSCDFDGLVVVLHFAAVQPIDRSVSI